MKKLIYIANARIPTEKAHGIQIMKMCESFGELLARRSFGEGGEVELLVPRRLNPIKQDPFEYYGVRRSFKITKLPTLDLITFGLGSFGFFAETITFLISSAIYLLFRKYDILYTREWAAGLFFKNIVLEIHSLPTREAPTPIFLLLRIWKKAKALLVLTSFIKNKLVKFGVPENKILILPDAVDLDQFQIQNSKFEIREKLDLPQDKKIAVYTGQLFEWKGAGTFIEAARLLKDIDFCMVGGSMVGELPYSNLHFVGQKPHSEIPLWLKAADVLVLPNKKGFKISEEYTSPLKLFEYMASGRPIVASDLPSLREILTEKEAVFFKPNDPADSARAIKEVLSNPQLASEISQNALQKVQNHTWQNRAKRAIDFITGRVYN
ncbi:hypothetical protein A3G55_00755 [Candidatus Giovannonibacteria bacterium RIFCSPLOWO2_12_FULL_44_25]|uniref:Glycosyl transferase family 1 domain-containing protein n=2 Tax=Candidatus Giovannoniibacteriota TaxID=1752738 RepID=A0A1F5WAW7_9BACT|nr:MAG: Glycosyl transferase group 1 [Parcubacteria group bacterium GW2011_GWC1_44_10]KKT60466.1 MAG: Glycosyl transferase group 1 [Candidatus Giovannonibacteria bacterium GW2011_GWA1_44_25]KKU30324.1 MAG: Glycosyl transferase group 1 [Candidatus Giovannonibacteria bacterium GW2011_GWB1_46_20]OGF50528.1 MAG: hypothetical protein A2120_02690 [Candidatus Giovannonibacteria bacterium GWA2_45_15]OGF59661.1 MAG: hypothetical protein A2W40_04585 [Candidatus Giovannonibacteria bacterium RIFCSPHIGHO2_0